jgi:hypothetical protein
MYNSTIAHHELAFDQLAVVSGGSSFGGYADSCGDVGGSVALAVGLATLNPVSIAIGALAGCALGMALHAIP